eukprot:2569013-Pyramimonas_sp.AAC.2
MWFCKPLANLSQFCSERKNVLVPVVVVTVVVSIPLTQYLRTTYRRYKFYRWGYKPGSLSGFLASKLEEHSKARRETAPVRVYMDGCFDMMHYGHANALRQVQHRYLSEWRVASPLFRRVLLGEAAGTVVVLWCRLPWDTATKTMRYDCLDHLSLTQQQNK